MTELEITWLAVAAAILAISVVIVAWLRWRRRDQEFVGLTPGLFPSPEQRVGSRRVRGGQQWKGTVAVSFTPPAGIGPAVAGTVVDGKVDGRDLAAMLVDLSLRGFFAIEPMQTPDAAPLPQPNTATSTAPHPPAGTAKPKDWLFVKNPQQPADHRLSPAERRMLTAVFAHGPSVRMSDLKVNLGFTLREAQIDLYREMIDRGWYRKHPRSRARWTAVFGVLLVFVAALLALGAYDAWERHNSFVPFAIPGAILISALLLLFTGPGRSPRTAAGTAARIQTLGFEKYLATAEADQIRHEEAIGLFTRYLPFAIVFGLADRWAKVVGEAIRSSYVQDGLDLAGAFAMDPWAWYAMSEMTGLAADGIGALIDAGSAMDVSGAGLMDISGAFEAFTDSASGIFDEATGCLDGCDGCDAGCFDF